MYMYMCVLRSRDRSQYYIETGFGVQGVDSFSG